MDVELAVEQIEAELAQVIGDHRRTQWRAHVSGGLPPLPPPELVSRALAARLAQLLPQAMGGAVRRRLVMLTRAARRARIDADPKVSRIVGRIAAAAAAPSAGALAALARARNRAAGGSFAALLLADEELGGLREPSAAAQGATAAPAGDRRLPEPAAVRDYLARRGLDPGPVLVTAAATARCLAIDPPREVAISMEPGTGDAAIRRLVHELGHLRAARVRDAAAPWPLADAPTRGIAEGVAEWFADSADSAGFGREVLGLSAADAGERARARAAVRLPRGARRVARGHRELALYASPDTAEGLADPDRTSMALDPGAAVAYAAAESVRTALEQAPGPLDALAPAAAAALTTLAATGAAISREEWLGRVAAAGSL